MARANLRIGHVGGGASGPVWFVLVVLGLVVVLAASVYQPLRDLIGSILEMLLAIALIGALAVAGGFALVAVLKSRGGY